MASPSSHENALTRKRHGEARKLIRALWKAAGWNVERLIGELAHLGVDEAAPEELQEGRKTPLYYRITGWGRSRENARTGKSDFYFFPADGPLIRGIARALLGAKQGPDPRDVAHWLWLIGAAEPEECRRLFDELRGDAVDSSVIDRFAEAIQHSHGLPLEALTPGTYQQALDQFDTLPVRRIPETTGLPERRSLPVRLPDDGRLVGRNDDLVWVAERMRDGPGAIVLHGPSGIGKSRLAHELATRFGRYVRQGGVFYLDFQSPHTLRNHVAQCGPPLGLPPGLGDDEVIERIPAVWAQPIPRLLIFDNCDSRELFERWCPRAGGARVVVLSHYHSLWQGAGLPLRELRPLDEAKSIDLLRHAAGELGAAEAAALAQELGGLPLDLIKAAGALKEGYAPGAYLVELRRLGAARARPTLLATQSLRFKRDAFTLSLRLIEALAWLAADVPIPTALLASAVGETADSLVFEWALGELFSAKMVRGDAQLVQTYTLDSEALRAEAAGEPARAGVAQAILALADSAIESDDLPLLRLLPPHLEQLIADWPAATPEGVQWRFALARVLQRVGPYAQAAQWYEEAAGLAAHMADGPIEVATIRRSLGLLYLDNGQVAEARALFEALARQHEAAGDVGQLALIENYLGETYREEEQFHTAREHLERALRLLRALPSREDDHASRVAEVQNNLAAALHGLYQRGGQPDSQTIRSLYGEVLSFYQRNPSSGYALTVEQNMAELLIDEGRNEEALEQLEGLLRRSRRLRGEQHRDTATVLELLSRCSQKLRRPEAARAYLREAYQIVRAFFGDEHRFTVERRERLGALGWGEDARPTP